MSLVEHAVDGRADRHIDAQLPRKVLDAVRGIIALDGRAHMPQRFLDGLALPDVEPGPLVAAVLGEARHDQIADTRESKARLPPPTEQNAQRRNFRDRPRQIHCPQIVARAHAAQDSRAERHHVLERPAQLHTDHIVVDVDPEHVIHERGADALGRLQIATRQHTPRRHSA